jgi:hypothetical protein
LLSVFVLIKLVNGTGISEKKNILASARGSFKQDGTGEDHSVGIQVFEFP